MAPRLSPVFAGAAADAFFAAAGATVLSVVPRVSVLPRRNTGRFGSVSFAVVLAVADGSGDWSDGGAGAADAGAVVVLAVVGVCGGVETEDAGDAGTGDDGAVSGSRRRSLGGPSSSSRTGFLSTGRGLLGAEPAGCHFPSANQASPTRAAPPTVNKP